MLFQQTRQEVACARIAKLIVGRPQVFPQHANHGFVILQEPLHQQIGACEFSLLFAQPRQRQKFRKGSRRHTTQRSDPLRYFINRFIDRFILALEEFVQIVESRSGHIPMKIPRLRIKDIFIRQKGFQQRNDAEALVLAKADVDSFSAHI